MVKTDSDKNVKPGTVSKSPSKEDDVQPRSAGEWSVYKYYFNSVGFLSAAAYLFLTCLSAGEMTYQSK